MSANGLGKMKEEAKMSLGLSLTENQATGLKRQIQVDEIYFTGKSAFQENAVVKTTAFGRALFMDKQIQSAELDEFIYHESLVKPALTLHANPKTVFIGGGGEFATAREVLKYASVTSCVMVDIDEEACKQCIKELPTWHDGCINDKRLKVVYGDAYKYLMECKETFDVVIMDIADPVEAGPGYKLYTQEFYSHVAKNKLNKGGVLVTQSTAADLINAGSSFATIHNTLRSAFHEVFPYRTFIISFGGPWGFNLAWNRDSSLPSTPLSLTADAIDKILAEKHKKDSKESKFYDGITHHNLFNLPKHIRTTLKEAKQVSTIDKPCFMDYGALATE
mmetsp:Transcript_7541/g.11412  ORF Transcript_7541/g.11412 Transcript_7541/m.11412 type:complete len:334 (-) Transcript_7541:147-1148(-)|eukprot:CAMPEP_0167749780 /NCGR_PEP_ID=MMETSP0110_2-20121227/5611_1 /TAXON_ID=629695 /ORGANISM="Gymnochlora sp., Strain CCMP2014" /LENGTH=333 /DNA_ID=CAMNT_0007634999 /DNA_START=46 /DNA_END=1047 /DNA_ORIENTATION=-